MECLECNICHNDFKNFKLISLGCCSGKFCKECLNSCVAPLCPVCRTAFFYGGTGVNTHLQLHQKITDLNIILERHVCMSEVYIGAINELDKKLETKQNYINERNKTNRIEREKFELEIKELKEEINNYRQSRVDDMLHDQYVKHFEDATMRLGLIHFR